LHESTPPQLVWLGVLVLLPGRQGSNGCLTPGIDHPQRKTTPTRRTAWFSLRGWWRWLV